MAVQSIYVWPCDQVFGSVPFPPAATWKRVLEDWGQPGPESPVTQPLTAPAAAGKTGVLGGKSDKEVQKGEKVPGRWGWFPSLLRV